MENIDARGHVYFLVYLDFPWQVLGERKKKLLKNLQLAERTYFFEIFFFLSSEKKAILLFGY